MKSRLRMFAPLAMAATMLATPAFAAEYTITAIKALTGPLAFVGVPEANSIKQAVEELNAKKFLGEGNTLKLNLYDDANDRGQILSLMNRASLDDSLVILGTANSALAMGIAPALNDMKIPYIPTAQTAQPTTVSKYYLKITQSPQGAVQPLADFAVDKKDIKRLVIIYARDNDGHINNMKTFRDHLATKGKKPLLEETILMSETDFSAIATKIAGLNPDGVWLGANAAQAANIVIQLKQAGVAANTAFYGTSGLGVDYIRTGGKAVDNTYMTVDYNHDSKDPMNVAFIEGYTKRYGSPPDNFAAIGYSETYIAAAAIKASMPNPTREKVLEAIMKTKEASVVIGSENKWTMGPDQIPTYKLPVMVIKDGKVVAAQ